LWILTLVTCLTGVPGYFTAVLNQKEMTTGKAILGVLAGLAAGAAIGMLLAPNKGERSRKNLRRKSEDLAEAINDKIDEKFKDLLQTISGKVKQQASDPSSPRRQEV
jgi:gas vesicle protein